MNKKTIGGNRLGSGSKMQVELHPYERSTHDLGYVFRTTQAPGTLIPFMVVPGLPGDTFDLKLQADVKTHPTLGPLFGSFKLQLDVFEIPVRLYHSALLQNLLNIGNSIQDIQLPVLQSDPIPTGSPLSTPDVDNVQINPSALLAYLGIRGWGWNETLDTNAIRELNAIPFLGYWEIYKNYYANKQEEIGYYILSENPTAQTVDSIILDGTTINQGSGSGAVTHSDSVWTISYTGTQPDLNQIEFATSEGTQSANELASWILSGTTFTANAITPGIGIYWWNYADPNQITALVDFPLTNIDQVKQDIFANSPTGKITITSGQVAPYGPSIALENTPGSQCGLGIKTYQSDLFNNWVQTSWYETLQDTSAVSTTSGQFTIDSLMLARKVYDLLLRTAVSGGTYADWVDAAYDHKALELSITPIYHGGLSKEVVFQEVISTATSGNQPLATLAGRGSMSSKHKGGEIRIKCNEHCYIMGIVSLTPRLDYSQGNEWHTYALITMNDFHKPALDQIGFQSLMTEQMVWWDTQWTAGTFRQKTAGFQPAWTNYMTAVNKCYGNFAIPNNEMFMTLNRRYQMHKADATFQDLTTYIDPTHYNFIFAQTSRDAQNFWTQIGVDLIARRKMSAKIMPNL